MNTELKQERSISANQDSSISIPYINQVFSSELLCKQGICINEYGEISYPSLGSRLVSILKNGAWNYIISPLVLFGSLAMYTLVPIKVFKHEIKSFIRYLAHGKTKRILDFLGAVVGLGMCSFIFLIISLLIKLDSNGTIFYTQIRIGKNRRKKSRRTLDADTQINRRYVERRKHDLCGRPFLIYKFRTMREDAEKKCGPVWATDNDPRITTVGRFLRQTHLDELPQLLNILRGEMSFVGPRPERPHFVNQFSNQIPHYTDRLRVKPGLTGLAQVKCGYDDSMESVMNKLKYDLEYYHNGSLYSYFKIIVKTMNQTLSGNKPHDK